MTVYRIRIREHLTEHWQSYFGGLRLSTFTTPECIASELTGPLDEAGLHGTLERLRDLNLHLVSVDTLGEVEI